MRKKLRAMSSAQFERVHAAWASMDDWRGRCLWCGHTTIGRLADMGRGTCSVCGARGKALETSIPHDRRVSDA